MWNPVSYNMHRYRQSSCRLYCTPLSLSTGMQVSNAYQSCKRFPINAPATTAKIAKSGGILLCIYVKDTHLPTEPNHPLSPLLQFLHEPLPHPIIHHPPEPKSRHNPTHPRQTTLPPIHPHLPQSIRKRRVPVPIIQIQTHQMQWRADKLHRRRYQELRS